MQKTPKYIAPPNFNVPTSTASGLAKKRIAAMLQAKGQTAKNSPLANALGKMKGK